MVDSIEHDWLRSAQAIAGSDVLEMENFVEDAVDACYAGDISYEVLDEIYTILSIPKT